MQEDCNQTGGYLQPVSRTPRPSVFARA
ncbi:MAG: hypothetical protein E3J26_01130 [Candidatus Zixiibacteriota bacterium]|nr:MAG: hypothetical protein E3J26_01130 [candidate division Zixibacteria bacterium]